MTRLSPSLLVYAVILSTSLVVAPDIATAQSELTHTEDAAPIPRGMLRLRIINGWTRFDERFAANGTRRTLSEELSTNALGVAQLPRLAPVEDGLRSLSNDPSLVLSLGRLDVRSDARVVTTPLALEFGVTRRLSIGVLVPIVQTRRSVQLLVNPDSAGSGNVGYVPFASRVNAARANRDVFEAFQRASDSLGTLLTRCAANSAGNGCAAVNASGGEARAAQVAAQRFAASVKSALGTDSAGAIVAARTGSALAASIDKQRVAVNLLVRKYLGGAAGASSSVFFAPNALSYIDLNGRAPDAGLLRSPLGGGLDSLHTADRLGLGDVAVSAQLLVYDHFQRDSLPPRGVQTRLSVGAGARFATSRADSARNLVDIATGEGAAVEAHAAMDVMAGPFGLTAAARVVKGLARTSNGVLSGDPSAAYPIPSFGAVTRTPGTVIALDLSPRLFLSEWFALDGHYGLERRGEASATPVDAMPDSFSSVLSGGVTASTSGSLAQRVGAGVRYSTVDAYLRGRARYPIEMSFTHLETLSGDPGAPKYFRDQIQLRLFYRLLGR